MRTIVIDLPLKCRGYIYEDVATGEQCCVLNAKYNRETNVKTYKHECDHADHDDFRCCESINTIEIERHGGINYGKI